jgi:hypothetical protein
VKYSGLELEGERMDVLKVRDLDVQTAILVIEDRFGGLDPIHSENDVMLGYRGSDVESVGWIHKAILKPNR